MMSLIRRGLRSDYSNGVDAKRLSAVETSLDFTNQHEFDGFGALRLMFGKPDCLKISSRFVWLGEEQEAQPACLTDAVSLVRIVTSKESWTLA